MGWPLHSYIDKASVLIGTVFIVSRREVCGILMSDATAVRNTQTELHSAAFSETNTVILPVFGRTTGGTMQFPDCTVSGAL